MNFPPKNVDERTLNQAKLVRCKELARVVMDRAMSDFVSKKAEGSALEVIKGRYADLLFEVARGVTSLIPNSLQIQAAREILEKVDVDAATAGQGSQGAVG